MKRSLLLLTAALCLLSACKASVPPKITATDTGESGPGAQTIKAGNATLLLSADAKPLSYTIGDGENLLRPDAGGPGFYLSTGTGAAAKTIPFVSSESKDGKLILTAEDNTRVTLAVNAGDRFISFRLEKIEDVPKDTEPTLNFVMNFKPGIFPETVPFDYMCLAGGRQETVRSFIKATWPFLWQRGDHDPLGGFAFFVPRNDEEHNEALLRIWTEEKVPHPKIEGEWTYERAKEWAEEWFKNAEDTTHLVISAEKPEDLDPLIEYAKKLKVSRVYMHGDTWRGGFWPKDNDALWVNTKVFPRGEEDLKIFIDKLKEHGIGTMMHTLGYGIPPEGSKYMGKGKKTDRRLANWGKGKLEQSVSATDTTMLFRPDSSWKPSSRPPGNSYMLIGDEVIQCTITDTDKPVWTLKDCKRGVEPAAHEAGIEIIGLTKRGQNFYPDSRTDLPEITGRDYAEFFNRLGVVHHEFDGKEFHDDFEWGFPKWSMFVYQNTKMPITTNTSSGSINQWDLMYRFKKNGTQKLSNKGSNHGCGTGNAALDLERDNRLATSPIENHFTLGHAASINTPGFVFGKPEPMFGIFPHVIEEHGLEEYIAEQFTVWRELKGKLTPELRNKIGQTYLRNPASHHFNTKVLYEARRAGTGYELQPFTVMTRGEVDAPWTTYQEYNVLMPRQYVTPGMRVKLENPFERQAPQFIIRVMNGYTGSVSETLSTAPNKEMTQDMKEYLAAAGVEVESATPPPAPTPAAAGADPYSLQPKAAQMGNPGKHVFADEGSALSVSLNNTGKDPLIQKSGLPTRRFKANTQNARGLALTVTGDGSGALLVVTLGLSSDYIIPIDFTGRKDIVIPVSETTHALNAWRMRQGTKGAQYGPLYGYSIGFGQVPGNTHAKVLIENLRILGEKPSSITNPVIHAGEGTLAIQGEVKSGHYLWYQGGDKVGVYDKNWNFQTDLPVVATNYEVDKGFSEYWIEGQCANPPPWFNVQFITKGETIKFDPPAPAE